MADIPEALPAPPPAEATPSYWETDETTLNKIREAVEKHVSVIQEKHPHTKTDEAFLANELGHVLALTEPRAAYHCYQHAFLLTPPYDKQRHTFAINLLRMANRFQALDAVAETDRQSWLSDRRVIVEEAISCMRNYLLELKGTNYDLLFAANNASAPWVDQPLRLEATKVQNEIDSAAGILEKSSQN